jgi:alpha-tubulin suppressor-like RCC1 family protein
VPEDRASWAVGKTLIMKLAPLVGLALVVGLVAGMGVLSHGSSGSPPTTTPAASFASAASSPAAQSSSSRTSPPPIATRMPEPTPTPLTGVTAIAAGSWHTCAIVSDGSVYCWGDNSDRALGDGSSVDFSVTPVKVAGVEGATAIAAGSWHTCAIVSEGRVQCWGSNQSGQLGGGSPQDTAALVGGIRGAAAIAAGGSNTCVLLTGGTVECWGMYSYSDYAADVVIGTKPRRIQGIQGAIGLASDIGGSCAIFGDGTIECWGSAYYSNFGLDVHPFSWKPKKTSGIGPAQGIDMGGVCVLLSTGGLECRDFGAHKGCPDCDFPIVEVPGITDAVAISHGDPVYALLSDGTVWTWYGTGPDATATTPARRVEGVSGATAIAQGSLHACALISDGTVNCWGDNISGQLGSNSPPGTGRLPRVVAASP